MNYQRLCHNLAINNRVVFSNTTSVVVVQRMVVSVAEEVSLV